MGRRTAGQGKATPSARPVHRIARAVFATWRDDLMLLRLQAMRHRAGAPNAGGKRYWSGYSDGVSAAEGALIKRMER